MFSSSWWSPSPLPSPAAGGGGGLVPGGGTSAKAGILSWGNCVWAGQIARGNRDLLWVYHTRKAVRTPPRLARRGSVSVWRIVGFRSAKGPAFTERKPTNSDTVD